jgi:hypothetical protein
MKARPNRLALLMAAFGIIPSSQIPIATIPDVGRTNFRRRRGLGSAHPWARQARSGRFKGRRNTPTLHPYGELRLPKLDERKHNPHAFTKHLTRRQRKALKAKAVAS